MEKLLNRLRDFDALRDPISQRGADKVALRSLTRQPPELAPESYLDRLPEPLRRALASQGIVRLYAHQVDAIERILAGDDVVLEAPTASGKTLCFNVPLVLKLMEDKGSHALMIHPMKALSNDQRQQFQRLVAGGENGRLDRLESWIYDGDTDQQHRKLVRSSPPSLLLTNPEMLHLSFLRWNEQWLHFLRNLRLLVIDEIHEYRGYFGTNVALLLRRFLGKLAQLGVHPQLVLATATCGNAQEHAFHLTNRKCKLVRATNLMRPERHLAFINPNIPDFHFHEIYRLRIARAALACVAHGLSTLVFCPSRRFAEEATVRARNDARERGIDPETIAPYRNGYDAELRRQIENGLRSGRYRAVFSTNALEIGLDIGRLDACILAGFPDSPLSAWQRIGRAGRNWDKKAYVLFYAFNNPFDRFFADNIDAFLNKPLDQVLIGVDNEELMRRHLPYLIHEVGSLHKNELRDQLGSPFHEYARKQTAGTKPVRGYAPPYQQLSIRGNSGLTRVLKYKGREIGTISDVHLFREAYVGAIYGHFGKSYRVVAHTAAEVLLEDAEPNLRTEGIFFTVTQEADVLAGNRYAESLSAYYGRLTVFENFNGYRVVDTRSGQVLDEEHNQLARSSNVRGFWLEFAAPSIVGQLRNLKDVLGVEQLLRIGTPFVVPCDRHDLGTLTSLRTPASVYLYETVPGGIGIAERALEAWPVVITTAVEMAERCECRHGCPSCLVPPRLPTGEQPRKQQAITLARKLVYMAENAPREVFDRDLHRWRSTDK